MNFTVLSMEFPIRNCLREESFSSGTMGIFIRLFCHIPRQMSQQIADKKIQMSSEMKLLAGTKVYYCFDLKGDNFKVNQL